MAEVDFANGRHFARAGQPFVCLVIKLLAAGREIIVFVLGFLFHQMDRMQADRNIHAPLIFGRILNCPF